jgi:hypothetical protein
VPVVVVSIQVAASAGVFEMVYYRSIAARYFSPLIFRFFNSCTNVACQPNFIFVELSIKQ